MRKFYTGEEIRKKYHFMLYSIEDEPLLYFENYDELRKHVNLKSKNIACRCNKMRTNKITIVLNQKMYRLYVFDDEGR